MKRRPEEAYITMTYVQPGLFAFATSWERLGFPPGCPQCKRRRQIRPHGPIDLRLLQREGLKTYALGVNMNTFQELRRLKTDMRWS